MKEQNVYKALFFFLTTEISWHRVWTFHWYHFSQCLLSTYYVQDTKRIVSSILVFRGGKKVHNGCFAKYNMIEVRLKDKVLELSSCWGKQPWSCLYFSEAFSLRENEDSMTPEGELNSQVRYMSISHLSLKQNASQLLGNSIYTQCLLSSVGRAALSVHSSYQ